MGCIHVDMHMQIGMYVYRCVKPVQEEEHAWVYTPGSENVGLKIFLRTDFQPAATSVCMYMCIKNGKGVYVFYDIAFS